MPRADLHSMLGTEKKAIGRASEGPKLNNQSAPSQMTTPVSMKPNNYFKCKARPRKNPQIAKNG